MVFKGCKVIASRRPFTCETRVNWREVEWNEERFKRNRDENWGKTVVKKAKVAGSPFERAKEIRARKATQFEPVWVAIAKSAEEPTRATETVTPKFLELLDSLHAVRPFNRVQVEILAKHGIPSFRDQQFKEQVREPTRGVIYAHWRAKPPVCQSNVGVGEIARSWGLDSQRKDECISTRPPGSSVSIPRCRRPQSQRDISLAAYRQDSGSLWCLPELY